MEYDGKPRHMDGVARHKIVDLMEKVAHGDLDAVNQEPWLPGY